MQLGFSALKGMHPLSPLWNALIGSHHTGDSVYPLTDSSQVRGLCVVAENEDCKKNELKKPLDDDKKTRELKFYRDVVKHNMSQDRIDVLRASHQQYPSFSSLWAYDATSAPQSKPLSGQVDNNQCWYKPALTYSDPLPLVMPGVLHTEGRNPKNFRTSQHPKISM